MFNHQSYNQGVAALFTVVIVGSAALLMASGAVLLGIGELDRGFTAQQGAEAFAFADGCVDEALERLRLDSSYTGGSITVQNDSCAISVSTPGGSERTIVVIGNVNNTYYKTVQVEVTLGGVITIDSWQELSS